MKKQCKTIWTFQISQSFLSISAANYMGKSGKENPITNNNNHDPGEAMDQFEEIDEQTTSKKIKFQL